DDGLFPTVTQEYYIHVMTNSIFEVDNSLLSLYPNPANEMVYVDYNTQGDDISMNIYNMLGEIVYTLNAETSGRYHTSIDISEFSTGIYTVELMSGEKISFKKLIVE
ncbi:MAG: hypothetical protein C0594_15010, partial [Marinilabiliales bacterium]